MTLTETWTLEKFLATDDFDGRRVELLGGKVYEVAPETWENQEAIGRLTKHLTITLAAHEHSARWIVHSRGGTTTTDSYILPDIFISPTGLRRLPTVSDCAVIVEVANSTVKRDEGTKRNLAHSEGAELYYVIDLAGPTLTLWGQTVMSFSVPKLDIEIGLDELWQFPSASLRGTTRGHVHDWWPHNKV